MTLQEFQAVYSYSSIFFTKSFKKWKSQFSAGIEHW